MVNGLILLNYSKAQLTRMYKKEDESSDEEELPTDETPNEDMDNTLSPHFRGSQHE